MIIYNNSCGFFKFEDPTDLKPSLAFSSTPINTVPAHDAPTEKLAHDLEAILGRATECVLEELVPTGGLLLGVTKGANVPVGGCALGTLDPFSPVAIADATTRGGRV